MEHSRYNSGPQSGNKPQDPPQKPVPPVCPKPSISRGQATIQAIKETIEYLEEYKEISGRRARAMEAIAHILGEYFIYLIQKDEGG